MTGAELGTFNWLIERWGADCVLEPERSVKEYVRHAIQQTAEKAEKTQTYHVTGWKMIDNHWEYLLPNDGKHDVSLRGKLSRYERADNWKISKHYAVCACRNHAAVVVVHIFITAE